ncbi:MAG TPA: maleylacetoacetate isomerase [Polyangiaceae bacterium]|jgi:maleylacetoacetate isomerase/maleylpyruvate isomerase|nr:maleylacetoacetate isomerase [Polyangiaceae bacterium]
MILHNYFRSSASYRVRIALNLKGLAYEYRPVHLSRGGGEQFTPEFRALSPLAVVPVLEHAGKRLTQSLAILEYLDEIQPEPPLLPPAPLEKARVRALALSVACEIHPLNNLRVLNYLTGTLGATADAKNAWYRHWVSLGLNALEQELRESPFTGKFCHGDAPTMADCCLIPQLFNARRFECDLSPYRTLLAIEETCLALPSFGAAAPERQPDAE